MSNDARIRHLTADVARFCAESADLAPGQRLRQLTRLRTSLEDVTGQALDEGMKAARNENWGLRRIGEAADLSHETVRHRLARTSLLDGAA
ncbi:hypothetical protein ACFQL8_09460 [Streptomyces goshikiensis]|uniref:hypothetical protein n=1 Tax=Streptomyces goshikiensis TaxID=1942 RepID=UPI0016776775|nr:hypothetical protein [Streptomyces goshikiensis]GHD82370.1 hypothetical protein GCM10010336_69860 [Streptomyces goshikiensis]